MDIQSATEQWLLNLGFTLIERSTYSTLFEKQDQNTHAVIIDHTIGFAHDLPYGEYTHYQNRVMHTHDYLYRFQIDNQTDFEQAKSDYYKLVEAEKNGFNFDTIKQFGQNRGFLPDSTPVEYYFENTFLDIYGRESESKILKEASFPDINGVERFYDYLIEVRNPHYFIAIEQNGEQFHHPASPKVTRTSYQSQLRKQNSFISQGNKLYRWSIGGMIDKENFYSEIKRFLGSGDDFLALNHIKGERKYRLYHHQSISLHDLKKARTEGEEAFLVVLPTGTGKTAIFIEDIRDYLSDNPEAHILIIEPKVNLCNQIEEALQESRIISHNLLVKTYAWFIGHYSDYKPDFFDYMVIDEAHHAAASSLKRAIQYYRPKMLLGMTATDKRLDDKKLEEIFGNYETQLSLKEAIIQGILAPVHAFRIRSNLDFSSVRYNGKDYVASDLQKTIVIDSRDQLIVDTLRKYFSGSGIKKQGIVFCVSVAHAKSLAKRLESSGFKAKAVSGYDNNSLEYIADYQKGNIDFLTSCSLIHEGWDSPRTSIIVMARPTMSKVLYTQQIGRGTRKWKGKEALYIIDVVDNYGPHKNPWSIHSLLKIQNYIPWSNILGDGLGITSPTSEEVILSGLYEEARKIEKLDIFTFEEQYGSFLSKEQLARELFVSTGTITSWIRNDKIKADVEIPFGRSRLEYFDPYKLPEIRSNLGLKEHNEETIVEDFYEFLETGTYTFSYKMIFLLAFFTHADTSGICRLDKIVDSYRYFYLDRINKNGSKFAHEKMRDGR